MGRVVGNTMLTSQAQFSGKTLVVGLGATGMSVVRFLAARGEALAVTDSRDIPPGLETLKSDYPDVARFTGGFDERAFASADRLVVSPGISLSEPVILQAQQRGIPVIGDIELFAQYVDAPVIAITGSNGKTTVTTLLGEMARKDERHVGVGGNIGTPALDLLDQEHDLYVLELSSFQLESLSSLKPVAATVLNISEDHMDRYASLDDYAQAKARIFSGTATAVINRDDRHVMTMPAEGQQLFFSLHAPQAGNEFGIREINGQQWLCHGKQKLCVTDELLVQGKHNMANALAALALGQAAGLSMTAMLAALKCFTGLPHRTQFVAEIEAVKYYNDSKATNVGACTAALTGLDKGDSSKAIVILGGDCKEADFSGLTEVVRDTCRAVVLMGRDAPQIKNHLPDNVATQTAADMKSAVKQARQFAIAGDRVLLSPACASFDMFRNFEDRGERFIAAVREMMQ